MSEAILRITLLSDTCTSNGGIQNAAVDTEVVCDDYGLPYIPGRRIKGCLRECALEINDWGGAIPIGRLFGEKGNRRGLFTIRNACIAKREQMVSELLRAEGSMLANPRNVLESYTLLRSQTAICSTTGVARHNSLRTMRVVRAGTVLEAPISFPEEYRGSLEACCRIFRHIGISRTRGFGEIRAEIVEREEVPSDAKQKEEAPVSFNTTSLAYVLELLEPLVCKSVERQESRSEDYVEGAKLLGCVAAALKKEGKDVGLFLSSGGLKISNAYLMDAEGHRLTEISAAYYGIKNDDRTYLNKIYESDGMVEPRDGGGQPVQIGQLKHSYVYQDKDCLYQYDVSMEERYHHSLPEDKSIGRALGGEDGEGIFYQISSIRAGQSFKGYIEGEPAVLEKIGELLPNGSLVTIGYGSSAEYGLCRLSYQNVEEKRRETTCQKIAATLVSPAIVYGENAVYSTSPEDLYDEILYALQLPGKGWQSAVQFSKITSVGGFHVTWGLRKPTLLAFDKGTTVVITLKTSEKLKDGTYWIGERNLEGYGECKIQLLQETGHYKGIRQKPQRRSLEERVDLDQLPMLQPIADYLFDQFMEEKAGIAALCAEDAMKNKDIWLPTVGNLLTMCRKDRNLQEVKRDCQSRYGVVDKGKQQKGKAAEKILSHVQEMFEAADSKQVEQYQGSYLEQSFMSKYQMENYRCSSGSEMKYLRYYLVQLKYMLRRSEKEGDTEK